MVVLDADSVMSGECLTRLVLIAEANPGAGIIQTVPRAAGRDTLFARVQQFASFCLWPGIRGRPALLAAGRIALLGAQRHHPRRAVHEALRARPTARAWRIIGRDPFPRLRRGGPHATCRLVGLDSLRPAGQLRGDAAEPPRRVGSRPSMVPGQPMNMRLFLMKGLHPAHRAVFMTGVMAYLSRATLVLVADPGHRPCRRANPLASAILRPTVPVVPTVAGVAPGARHHAVIGDGLAFVPAQDSGEPPCRGERLRGRVCASPYPS